MSPYALRSQRNGRFRLRQRLCEFAFTLELRGVCDVLHSCYSLQMKGAPVDQHGSRDIVQWLGFLKRMVRIQLAGLPLNAGNRECAQDKCARDFIWRNFRE